MQYFPAHGMLLVDDLWEDPSRMQFCMKGPVRRCITAPALCPRDRRVAVS